MDDRQQYDRTSQRDQECHGCERGVVDVASGEDQAADERTDNADHDLEDDALLTICLHDDAGKPSDNAANDEPHENSHNHSPVIQKTIWPPYSIVRRISVNTSVSTEKRWVRKA